MTKVRTFRHHIFVIVISLLCCICVAFWIIISLLHHFSRQCFFLKKLVLLSRQFIIAYIEWLGDFVSNIQYLIESIIMFKWNFSYENLNKCNYIIICDIFTGWHLPQFFISQMVCTKSFFPHEQTIYTVRSISYDFDRLQCLPILWTPWDWKRVVYQQR